MLNKNGKIKFFKLSIINENQCILLPINNLHIFYYMAGISGQYLENSASKKLINKKKIITKTNIRKIK